MKQLNQFINERLKLTKNSKLIQFKYFPKDVNQLRNIICDKINETLKQQTKNTIDYLDCNDIDVSNLNSLTDVFSWYEHVKIINVSAWNVANVEDMSNMFNGCDELEQIIGLEYWNPKNLKYLRNTFGSCYNLKELHIDWNMSNVEYLNFVFGNCYSLEKIIGIENWNVENVLRIWGIFKDCKSLTTLNLSKWNPKSATNPANMFKGCVKLTTVGNIDHWEQYDICKGDILETVYHTFEHCDSLKNYPSWYKI